MESPWYHLGGKSCKASLYIYIYIKARAAYTTLYLSMLQETSYTIISFNNMRMYYEMQLPIGEP